MSNTNWEKIISSTEISSIKSRRSKTFHIKKERRTSLTELRDEGWELHRELKDNKYVIVKKDKKFDEIFEDKVWMLFANMGFTYMSEDRNFRMSYEMNNPNFTQQIDVFAADDETVLIVECKSAESTKEASFKTEIEALNGKKSGLIKEIKKNYRDKKIKFIFATNNFIMSDSDLNKLNEWDIEHFSESKIEYYSELAKHIGLSSKYQLLGNLFADREIKNMEDSVPAIQGKMGRCKYYSFSIEPERLLKIGYVLHRNEANSNLIPTYQRLIKKKRLNEVQKFVNNGGYFPNSIIISIDTKEKGLRFEQAEMKYNNDLQKVGLLHLPKRYRSAYIIDGQHRLYGYSGSDYSSKNSIPVVAFEDLDRLEQINLFMQINENQKPVPKSLRVTLNADMLWDSNNYNERRQALRSKLAQMLGDKPTSPLQSMIVVGEEEKTQHKCITVEALQASLKKTSFFTTYSSRNAIVNNGTFDRGENQNTCDLFYPFLENCLKYIRSNSLNEWQKGETENGILTINRGIQAVIRVIDDIVSLLVVKRVIDPLKDSKDKVLNNVYEYLDPLLDYINNISMDERKDLRGYFGGGADTRFLRTFQRVIALKKPDFNPDGLSAYWEDQTKIYNEETIIRVQTITTEIKNIISLNLEQNFKEQWQIGIPKTIYTNVMKNVENLNYGSKEHSESGNRVNFWDMVTIDDCKNIVIYGKNWSEIFSKFLSFPRDTNGDKYTKIQWMEKLEKISKKLSKTKQSVSKEESDYILEILEWITEKSK